MGKHVLTVEGPEPGHDYSKRIGLEDRLAHLLCHLEQHIGGSKILIATDLAGEFETELRGSLTAFFEEAIEGMTPRGDVSREYLARFLTGALLQVIRDWACDGLRESPLCVAKDFSLVSEQLFVEP